MQWPKSLEAMQLSQYRWLFLGNIAFFFVVQGQILTRVFLAWELTHQETSLATISFTVAVPMLLASIVSGAVVDRVERRKLIMIGQSIILVNDMFILSMLLTDKLEFWHLLCTAFTTGCAFPFILPARLAITYDVTGAKFFANGMALSNAVSNLSRIAGPAVMGIVLDMFGVKAAYTLAVVLYSFAIVCMLGVSPSKPAQAREKPLFEDVAYGFKYFIHHRHIMLCVLFGMLPIFLAIPVQSLFVVFADEVWQVGERGFGMLMAASGIGGLLGSMWVAVRGDNPRRIRLIFLTALAMGIFLALFSLTPAFYLALIPLVLAHICANTSQTLNHTAALILVDNEVRGRISGILSMTFGLTPLGLIPLAFAAESFGVAQAVFGASCVLIVSVSLFYGLSPTLRKLDYFVSKSPNRAA